MLSEMAFECVQAVEIGPVTKWIERYYQEKLDRRPGRNGMTASIAGQMFTLN